MIRQKFAGNTLIVKSILHEIPKIAVSNSAVLIQGETGVGKELIADIIHSVSARKDKPFIKVNLSEYSPALFESELFGHVKGAFTGAIANKKGLFEEADTGTIFLDEIDDFPIHLQTKILRVLESNEIKRVGETKPIKIDVRIITATKNNLRKLIEQKIFREDLYHRLNTIQIVIPPLRERQEDILLLVSHFLQAGNGIHKIQITEEAMTLLLNYRWGGNVRELKHAIEGLTVLKEGEIKPEDLPDEIKYYNSTDDLVRTCTQCFHDNNMQLEETMLCVEKKIIRDTINKMDGSSAKIAERLGIGNSTLHDKMKKHNLRHTK